MEVFISWSGLQSKHVAQSLRQWLPQVIQALRPWMSEEDVYAGAKWFSEIGAHLEVADVGIICLTPENLNAPWILFEAGALAKTVDAALVIPYLVDLEPNQVTGPLSQFQGKQSNESEILAVLRTLNSKLKTIGDGNSGLSDLNLEQSCRKWWPELEAKPEALPQTRSQELPQRTPEQMLDELLALVRQLDRRTSAQALQKTLLPDLLNFIRERRAALAGFMEQGALLDLRESVLVVTRRNDIYVRYLNDNRNVIAGLASEFYGQPITVELKSSPRVIRGRSTPGNRANPQ